MKTGIRSLLLAAMTATTLFSGLIGCGGSGSSLAPQSPTADQVLQPGPGILIGEIPMPLPPTPGDFEAMIGEQEALQKELSTARVQSIEPGWFIR
ncbi:MAG: hypothetical protein WC045_00315 [Patescibacteria group bacterium]